MRRKVGRRFICSPLIILAVSFLVGVVSWSIQTAGIDSQLLIVIKSFINRCLGILLLISIPLLIIGVVFVSSKKGGSEKSFTVKEIIKHSRSLAKKHMSKFLLGIAIYVIIDIMNSYRSRAYGHKGYIINDIISIVGDLVLIRIALGFKNLALNIVSEAKAKCSDIFVDFKRSIKFLRAYILTIIIVIIGAVFLIVPGIIFAIKLSMTPYLILEKNIGPWQAMKISRKMTTGFATDVFVLGLLCALINILGALAILVGLLRTMPLTFIASAYIYKKISEVRAKAGGVSRRKMGDKK